MYRYFLSKEICYLLCITVIQAGEGVLWEYWCGVHAPARPGPGQLDQAEAGGPRGSRAGQGREAPAPRQVFTPFLSKKFLQKIAALKFEKPWV